MTQAMSPPTCRCSNHQDAPSYVRYLANGLRDTFDLDGVPLRIMVRKGGNPYAGRSAN